MHARRAEERDVAAICRICADGWCETYEARGFVKLGEREAYELPRRTSLRYSRSLPL
jgi:hypothetical protein